MIYLERTHISTFGLNKNIFKWHLKQYNLMTLAGRLPRRNARRVLIQNLIVVSMMSLYL